MIGAFFTGIFGEVARAAAFESGSARLPFGAMKIGTAAALGSCFYRLLRKMTRITIAVTTTIGMTNTGLV